MTKKVVLVIFLVFLLFMVGCAKNSDPSPGYPGAEAPSAPPRDDGEYGKGVVQVPPIVGSDGSLGGIDQKLIRNASVYMDVEKLAVAIDEITRFAKTAGGFVSQSSQYNPDGKGSAAMTLRVPAANVDKLLTDIDTLGKVTQRTTGSDDVTMQYVDLEARIRNLERQEIRLLDILDKAETIDDILRVEQELARVRGELETRTAEFRYLRDRVDYATVYISLTETPTASTTVTGSGLKGVWQRGVMGLVTSINAMLTGLGDFLVWFISALPYLLLVGVISTIFFKFVRKARIGRKDS